MNKEQLLKQYDIELKQKREQFELLKKSIKALEKERACIRFGFRIGDLVLQNRSGILSAGSMRYTIWKVSEFNGRLFEGFKLKDDGTLTKTPYTMYGKAEDFEVLEKHLLFIELSKGDVVKEFNGGIFTGRTWVVQNLEGRKVRKVNTKATPKTPDHLSKIMELKRLTSTFIKTRI